jgi:hypothetical protein
MMRLVHCVVLSLSVLGMASPLVAEGEDQRPSAEQQDEHKSQARACAARAAGTYGFQCHGSTFTGAAVEEVTFIGVVKGTEKGFYEGYGTFNSNGGSLSTHVAGNATFGESCFGNVVYTTNEILLPGGGTIPLPPVSFDFISVDDGNEILGTGVALGGALNEFVPRLTCRLVRTRK